MQKSFLAFMQADNNKARKKREENEGQEGGITKKQKVANWNGGRGGGRGGRDVLICLLFREVQFNYI